MVRFLCVCAGLAVLNFVACAADDRDDLPVRPADETVLQALPKVPSLENLGGEKQIAAFVRELIQKKEIKARVEVVLLKQKIVAEQETALSAEKERIRREERYNASYGGPLRGSLQSNSAEKQTRSLKMKLSFQVPEIETYTRLEDVYKKRAALAADVVEALTRLDRNADGKLSADEYRDAGHMHLAARKIFHSIDADNDGLISLPEIELARTLPADGAAAITVGAATKEAASAVDPLKEFDRDGNGILDLNEMKALSSLYLGAAIDAQHSAELCRKMIDALAVAQQTSAAKFENLTIELEESK